ncbi:citrate/2-methylcitrate synthase [Deinococcus arcticus]|uniref:citrate synthase (unknown stereospecificity) n=1 Tax=Deinococcus arcticus TaxID=2136176 RepID=A0A2T3W3M8_9DEIO|nr:citrate/2-methylcitrate synthase [Deinococcus arcticus]PTA66511.1 citrate synthase [Deinococcus arcticus]
MSPAVPPSAPLTTAQACAALGVKPATLYAYVSRGLVRSEPGPPGTRERRYHAGDVAALSARQAGRRDPQAAVQASLNWGQPVLDSALTTVLDGRLIYRGQLAVELAGWATVEEVAALLWTGEAAGHPALPLRARLNLGGHPRAGRALEALGYALTHAGAHDPAAHDSRPEARLRQAARTLGLLYATLERHCRVPPAPDLPLHLRLARAWARPAGAGLLRRALVLLADHELNVSAFAARVTASSGAGLAHSVLAALCALQGHRHGLAPLRAHDLLQSALHRDPRAALHEAARRFGQAPGFGHPLYPAGDPRAAALLAALAQEQPAAPGVQAALALCGAAQAETGDHPTLDLALAALIHALDRDAEDTATLFALGRAVGWLAHALEAGQGGLLRPRARYVGPAPADGAPGG